MRIGAIGFEAACYDGFVCAWELHQSLSKKSPVMFCWRILRRLKLWVSLNFAPTEASRYGFADRCRWLQRARGKARKVVEATDPVGAPEMMAVLNCLKSSVFIIAVKEKMRPAKTYKARAFESPQVRHLLRGTSVSLPSGQGRRRSCGCRDARAGPGVNPVATFAHRSERLDRPIAGDL